MVLHVAGKSNFSLFWSLFYKQMRPPNQSPSPLLEVRGQKLNINLIPSILTNCLVCHCLEYYLFPTQTWHYLMIWDRDSSTVLQSIPMCNLTASHCLLGPAQAILSTPPQSWLTADYAWNKLILRLLSIKGYSWAVSWKIIILSEIFNYMY